MDHGDCADAGVDDLPQLRGRHPELLGRLHDLGGGTAVYLLRQCRPEALAVGANDRRIDAAAAERWQ